MPFQELSKRKRKDVKVEDIQVRVCLFAFDILFLNGEVNIPPRLHHLHGLTSSQLASAPKTFSRT